MRFQKIGAGLTLFFFVLGGAAYPQQAASVDSGSAIAQAVGSSSTPAPRLAPDHLKLRADLNPYNISISEETGKIDEVFQGSPNSPLVVHVQDAHANYEAQVNIKKIIAELVEKYGFSLVQLEGAVSKLDPDALKPSYLEEANVRLADFLMREGRITGADAYAVEAGNSVELYGIEDQLLYLENIRMFKQIYSRQDQINAYFESVHEAFDSIGRKLFTPGQLDFTRKTEEFSQDRIDLLDYLLYLNGVAEKTNLTALDDLKEMAHYPNLVRIIRLQTIEKQIDQSALKKEGEALKEAFAKRNLLSAEVDELFARFENPQKGTKPRDYFLKLTETAERGQIEFLSYPQLRMFAEYLIYRDEIDHKAVFPELMSYKSYLEDKLFRGEDEKELLQTIDFAGLLEQYFRLEMSRDKIARYLEHRDLIKSSSIAAKLKTLAEKFQVSTKPFGDTDQLDSYMSDVEYFYQLVLKRDEIFIDKIISRMRSLGQDKTILVTGGFHKDGLTDHFRKQNLSYIVVSPKVGVEQGSENYIKVMLDQDIVVGGAFTGSFALNKLPTWDPLLGTDSIDFLNLAGAAAVSGYVLARNSALLKAGQITTDELVKRTLPQLNKFVQAHGRRFHIERIVDPGIRGSLATVYMPAEFRVDGKTTSGIFRAEVRTDTYDFVVTLIDQRPALGSRNLAKPISQLPELNRDNISSRFDLPNLERVNLVASPSVSKISPADLTRLSNPSNFPLNVFLPENFPAPIDASMLESYEKLFGLPLAATQRFRKTVVDDDGDETPISNLIGQVTASVEVGRPVTAEDVTNAVQLDSAQKNFFKEFYSDAPQQDVFSVTILDTAGNPELSRVQLMAILGELKANQKEAFAVYGVGVKAFANSLGEEITKSEPFKRILFIDERRPNVPIGSFEEAVDLVAKHVRATPGNWMNHRLKWIEGAERLSSAEFAKITSVLVPAGDAGFRLRDAIAGGLSEIFRIIAVDFEDPSLSGDPDLQEAVGDFQIRVLSRLRLVDVAGLLKELGIEVVKPDGQNQFQIVNSSAVRALVRSLYTAFVAISKAA